MGPLLPGHIDQIDGRYVVRIESQHIGQDLAGRAEFLGLQVHEVGGSYADTAGTEIERPKRYPTLRLVRTLEPGQVLTIEPGLYFIDSLLNDLQSKPAGRSIDWQKVARLKKLGGIRIEDNILVTANGHENLTRQACESG